MLFTITGEEQAAAEGLTELQGKLRLAEQRAGRFPLDDVTPEAREARDTEKQLTTSVEEAGRSAAAQRCQIKHLINEKVGEVSQGIDPSILLSLAEEVLSSLDGANGLRVQAILKRALLLVAVVGTDEEIQVAKAEALARKYKAYTNAGMPRDFVHAYLLAHAREGVDVPGYFLSKGIDLLSNAAMAGEGSDGPAVA